MRQHPPVLMTLPSMLSDRTPTPDVENVVSAMKKCPAQETLRKQPGGWIPQAKTSENKVHTVEETN